MEISSKCVQWEPTCSMQTDGRTDEQTDREADMTEAIVAFRNFVNVSRNCRQAFEINNYKLKICTYRAITRNWISKVQIIKSSPFHRLYSILEIQSSVNQLTFKYSAS